MNVSIIDLGVGNIYSVARGFERAGGTVEVITRREEIVRAKRLVLPGVGSFADAARRARELELGSVLRERLVGGTPLIGICLGMQLLFEEGEEDGRCEGLGLLPGRIVRLKGGPGLSVPHMGWQRLQVRRPCPLLPDASASPWFYFSHSYRAEADPADVSAIAEHGEEIPAVVARENLFGIQPHPEKSGAAGQEVLRRFLLLPPGNA